MTLAERFIKEKNIDPVVKPELVAGKLSLLVFADGSGLLTPFDLTLTPSELRTFFQRVQEAKAQISKKPNLFPVLFPGGMEV